MSSLNSEGTAWQSPVTVDTNFDAGFHCRLMAVDGRPAVAYANGALQFKLRIAGDETGQTWLSAVTIYSSADLSTADAAVLPGGIGAVCVDDGTGEVIYKYLEVNGGAAVVAGTTELFPASGTNTYSLFLGISGGLPMLTCGRGSGVLNSCFALDETGTSWTAPAPADLTGQVGVNGSVVAYGVPWICYYDFTSEHDEVNSGRAVEPQSVQWVNEGVLQSDIPNIVLMSMTRAGVHPAVCYVDFDTQRLIYGVHY
jgi:hypothetical protein